MTKKTTDVRGADGKLHSVDEDGNVFEKPEEKGKAKKPSNMTGSTESMNDPGQLGARIDSGDPGQLGARIDSGDPGQLGGKISSGDE